MSDAFVSQRHEAFSTPAELVLGFVRDSTRAEPLHPSRIVAGMENEIYRVESERGTTFIVRIKHFGDVPLAQEAWAMQQARDAGVPVPRVYAVETLDTPAGPRDAMVMDQAEGRPYSAFADTIGQRERAGAVVDAGRALRKLHRIETDGFYHRHADGTWDFRSWDELAAANLRDRTQERGEILAAGFAELEFELMVDVVKRYGAEFPCEQPVLCHADYGPNHVFFDDQLQVSAVIDFGLFQGGEPIADFAHGVEIWDVDRLREGYGDDPALSSKSFRRQLNMLNVGLRMGYLAHNVRLGNEATATRVAADLRKTLQTLRRL